MSSADPLIISAHPRLSAEITARMRLDTTIIAMRAGHDDHAPEVGQVLCPQFETRSATHG